MLSSCCVKKLLVENLRMDIMPVINILNYRLSFYYLCFLSIVWGFKFRTTCHVETEFKLGVCNHRNMIGLQTSMDTLNSCVILDRGPPLHSCFICLFSISQFCFLDLLFLKALPHYVEIQSKQTRQKNRI